MNNTLFKSEQYNIIKNESLNRPKENTCKRGEYIKNN